MSQKEPSEPHEEELTSSYGCQENCHLRQKSAINNCAEPFIPFFFDKFLKQPTEIQQDWVIRMSVL